jgi:inhibitor of cysteine peptidase
MSHKTVLFIIIIIIVLATTSGCGKSTDTKLTSADNGKTVNVKTGDLIVIELEGNPSTGYNWQAKDLDATALEQVGEPEFKSSNPGLIGSGGSITLTFKSLKAGASTINLVYHRSWETDVAPLSTYSVTIASK